jgi:hypothetical protein
MGYLTYWALARTVTERFVERERIPHTHTVVIAMVRDKDRSCNMRIKRVREN